MFGAVGNCRLMACAFPPLRLVVVVVVVGLRFHVGAAVVGRPRERASWVRLPA